MTSVDRERNTEMPENPHIHIHTQEKNIVTAIPLSGEVCAVGMNVGKSVAVLKKGRQPQTVEGGVGWDQPKKFHISWMSGFN
jgi:hypothetical protein